MAESKHTNRLINEGSLYLLQHAHNPVDWYPWSEEAFEKARNENKLILVSVGYSSCHWCHVMEKETFENDSAAAYMNEHFVCIKVDREERPDVDQVYMNAVQLMTQRGGWPLNCFTLPDGRPVFGGTYFPTDQWMNVLRSLVDLKENEPEKMEDYATRLTEGVRQSELLPRSDSDKPLDTNDMAQMVEEWKASWDRREGGPKRAPKFPLPNNYEFLLHYAYLKDDIETLDYVKTSLKKMALGGIYDQIGGGFARYSTDMQWKVPHFEKMLYDNGQLISLYSRAWRVYGEDWMEEVVRQSIEFCNRELLTPDGGYFSALDADSEGEEGKFYIWTKAELQQVLGADFAFASAYYSIEKNAFWEDDKYILLRDQDDRDLAMEMGMPLEDLKERAQRINATLLKRRDQRIRPGLDNKVLCSWNAMMISGLSEAYLSYGEPEHLERAIACANFVQRTFRKEDAGLYHSFTSGKAEINGYLEDYAHLIDAFIRLYQASFDENWLMEARQLTDYAIDHFLDDQSGMFWFTSDEDPPLIARKQELMDNVIPASNSVMAHNLLRLGHLFYRTHYEKMALQMVRNVVPHIDYGQSFSNWGIVHLSISEPFFEVAITGIGYHELRSALSKAYLPNALLLGGEKQGQLPLTEGKFLDTPTIFVCVDKACKLPVYDALSALEQINNY